MKKIILIISLAAFGCNKSSNKLLSPDEAYCVYERNSNNVRVFVSCEKSQEAATQKCLELRNAGHTGTESVKKSTCSDC